MSGVAYQYTPYGAVQLPDAATAVIEGDAEVTAKDADDAAAARSVFDAAHAACEAIWAKRKAKA